MAEAETSDVVYQANTKTAALRDDADIAGEARRVAQFLQVGRAAVMWTEHPHAVRPAQRDPGLAADPFDLRLPPAPVFAALGKAPVINDCSPDPSLRRRSEWLCDALVAYAKHGDIRRVRYFCDARVALVTEHGRVIGVDRKYRP